MTPEARGGRFPIPPGGGAPSLRFPWNLLRVPLIPFSLLYGALGAFRAGLYARGRLATHRLATPVISVGNLTVGGSGKTPLVEYLARLARQAGLRPVVLTRGYRRASRSQLIRACTDSPVPDDPRLLGDEPFMLYTRNPGLPVYIGKDRAAAGRLAEFLDAPDVMLLDDGFQHLRLARQLNVLLIDGALGLGNGRVLPWGPLREPLSAMGRADVILLTKAEPGNDGEWAEEMLRRRGIGAPLFRVAYRPLGLKRLDGGAELPPEALAGKKVSLVCAIARPAGFAATVEGLGAEVAALRSFRDHHPYPPADVRALERLVAAADPAAPEWLTTEKDAVKLRGAPGLVERMWVVEMEVVPEPAAAAFFFDFLSDLKLH